MELFPSLAEKGIELPEARAQFMRSAKTEKNRKKDQLWLMLLSLSPCILPITYKLCFLLICFLHVVLSLVHLPALAEVAFSKSHTVVCFPHALLLFFLNAFGRLLLPLQNIYLYFLQCLWPNCCVRQMVCPCFAWSIPCIFAFWEGQWAAVNTELTPAVSHKTRYSGQPGVKAACQLWQTAIVFAGLVCKTENEVSEWAATRIFVVFSAFSPPFNRV